MKGVPFGLIALLFTLAAFAEKPALRQATTEKRAPQQAITKKPAPDQATTWYKVMTGTIDKYPVSMFLFSLDGAVNGYYYYNKGGVPIPISGEWQAGNLQLRAPGDRRGQEIFLGALTDSTYTGSWSVGTLTYPFHLRSMPRDSAYLTFDYIWVKGAQKHPKHTKEVTIDDGPSYEVSTVWPSDSSAISRLLKRDIFTLLDLPWKEGTPVGQALVRSKNTFLTGSLRDAAENQPSYEYKATLNILYQTSRLLSLSMADYSFTGGAHGNSRELYYCYDLRLGKRLNIGDVIDTLRYSKAMSALLEQQYRINNQIPPDTRLRESLSQDTIPLHGNFYLTGTGIGFEYNPYEIGPYVLGGISFFFPYSQVMPYLQPSFKRRMGLFD
jgi:hypothetical protein